MAVSHRLVPRHLLRASRRIRGQPEERRVHITGYLRSREAEKPVNGKSKKSSATVKVIAWEVRAVRIAKLDRAVEVNTSTDIPTDIPAF